MLRKVVMVFCFILAMQLISSYPVCALVQGSECSSAIQVDKLDETCGCATNLAFCSVGSLPPATLKPRISDSEFRLSIVLLPAEPETPLPAVIASASRGTYDSFHDPPAPLWLLHRILLI